MPGLAAYVDLLRRNADVRNVWLAQLISYLGDWFASVALIGLILQLGGGALSTSFNMLMAFMPSAISSLFFAGYLTDRFDRKRLMIVLDVLRVGVALLVLLARTPDTLWMAFAVHATLTFINNIFNTASSAALPNLVDDPADLGVAGTLGQGTFAIATIVGAALGGAFTTAFGRDATFVFNALTFVASALLLLRVRRSFQQHETSGTRLTLIALSDGWRWLRSNPSARHLILANVAITPVFATIGLYGIFATRSYDVGDIGTSLLYSARGVGALIGPLLLLPVLRAHEPNQQRRALAALFTLSLVGHTLLGALPVLPAGMLGLALAFAGSTSFFVTVRVALLKVVPDAVRGRVLAVDSFLFPLFASIFTLVAGALAEWAGPGIATLACVGLAALGLVWWLVRRID